MRKLWGWIKRHVLRRKAPADPRDVYLLEPSAHPLTDLMERFGREGSPDVDWSDPQPMQRITRLSKTSGPRTQWFIPVHDIFSVGDLLRFMSADFGLIVKEKRPDGAIKGDIVGTQVAAVKDCEMYLIGNTL